MKRINLIVFFLLVAFAAIGQNNTDTWNMFAKTKFEPKYMENLKEYIFSPTFPAEIKAMEGKEITIEGYFVPYAPEGEDYILLSKYPQSQCFFCGGGGPESVAEVKFAKDHRKFKTDDLITVRGKLKLNSEDMEHMYFIITNAVLVSE